MRSEDLVEGLEVVYTSRGGETIEPGKVVSWVDQYVPTFGTYTMVFVRFEGGVKSTRVDDLSVVSHVLAQDKSDQETLLGHRLKQVGLTDGQIARACDAFFSVCFGCFDVDVKEKCQCQNDK